MVTLFLWQKVSTMSSGEWKGTPSQDPDNLMRPKESGGFSPAFKLTVWTLLVFALGIFAGREMAWRPMRHAYRYPP